VATSLRLLREAGLDHWRTNHLRDIEALSVAIPHTDAVVTDADAWDVAT
jgi:hypothetical protein